MLLRPNKTHAKPKPMTRSFFLKTLNNASHKNKSSTVSYGHPKAIVNKPFPLNPFFSRSMTLQGSSPRSSIAESLRSKKEPCREQYTYPDPFVSLDPRWPLTKAHSHMEEEPYERNRDKKKEADNSIIVEPLARETNTMISEEHDSEPEKRAIEKLIDTKQQLDNQKTEDNGAKKTYGLEEKLMCSLESIHEELKQELRECTTIEEANIFIMEKINWFGDALKKILEPYSKIKTYLKEIDTVFEQIGKGQLESIEKVEKIQMNIEKNSDVPVVLPLNRKNQGIEMAFNNFKETLVEKKTKVAGGFPIGRVNIEKSYLTGRDPIRKEIAYKGSESNLGLNTKRMKLWENDVTVSEGMPSKYVKAQREQRLYEQALGNKRYTMVNQQQQQKMDIERVNKGKTKWK